MNNFKLLRKLCDACGVSGFEEDVRSVIAGEIGAFVDEIRVDAMGNIIARKKGNAEKPLKLMVSAHIDEIGFLVSFIDNDGFIRLDRSGGIDIASLPGRPVTVCGTKKLPAIIGARALNAMSEDKKNKPADQDEIYVDTGLPAAELKKYVEIGDPVVMRQDCFEMGRLVCSKAIDDRVGVFCMIEAARAMQRSAFEIYFVGSSQEEGGLRGAGAGAFGIAPDIGVAVDVTRSSDVPGVSPHKHVAQLGHGVAIKIKDSGSLGHPGLIKCLRDLAEKEKRFFLKNHG